MSVPNERPRSRGGSGRGLEALIGTASSRYGSASNRPPAHTVVADSAYPFQPRRDFDTVELAELEASLKASGSAPAENVRRQGDAFDVIAGDAPAGCHDVVGTEITAIVREFDDRTMLVARSRRNLQRATERDQRRRGGIGVSSKTSN